MENGSSESRYLSFLFLVLLPLRNRRNLRVYVTLISSLHKQKTLSTHNCGPLTFDTKPSTLHSTNLTSLNYSTFPFRQTSFYV